MKRRWLRRGLALARRRPVTALAACGVALLVVAGLAAPWIAPADPLAIGAAPLAAPGSAHPLGTDRLGRDVLSRLLWGARISLRVAGLSVTLALVAGTLLGAIAGWAGGWVDGLVSRLTDAAFALPEIVLALVVMAILGPGFTRIGIAVGIVYTPIFTRVARAAMIRARRRPYLEAARALGLGPVRRLVRHALPETIPPLTVQATLSFAFAILAEASLSFLGLSGEADAPSWGLMLREAKDLMGRAWWLALFPGLAITLSVLALNLLGDGLRDALDPREAERG